MATDWFKMGVGFYRDPALIRAGEAAEVFFVRALGFCAENDTKGSIPKEALLLICPVKPKPRVDALVRERVLTERKDDYHVRSWDKWQAELDALQDRRRKDRERKAKEREAERIRRLSEDSPEDASADTGEDSPPIPSYIDGDGDGETPSVSKASRRKPETPAPDIFPPTDAMRKWITEHGISPDQAKRETDRFLEHHRSKDNRFRDWNAAWRKWMGGVTPDRHPTQPLSPGAELNRQMGLS